MRRIRLFTVNVCARDVFRAHTVPSGDARLYLPRRYPFPQAAVDSGGNHVAHGSTELEGGFYAAARQV